MIDELTKPILTLGATTERERRAMTRTESEFFVRCTFMEQRDARPRTAEDLKAEFKDDAPFALKVMLGRLAAADPALVYSLPVVLFLASLCETPGQVVMWAHHLVTSARHLPAGSTTTMADLASDFPWGLPSEDGYSRIWEAQKRGDAPGGNALDTAEAWRAR